MKIELVGLFSLPNTIADTFFTLVKDIFSDAVFHFHFVEGRPSMEQPIHRGKGKVCLLGYGRKTQWPLYSIVMLIVLICACMMLKKARFPARCP